MLVLVWVWESWFVGTKASDEPLKTTAIQELSSPAKSFVSVTPPAVSELLATSAAAVLAATSTPSTRSTTHDTEVAGNVYPAELPKGDQRGVSAQKANSHTKTDMQAEGTTTDMLHVDAQPHGRRGIQLKQGIVHPSTRGREKHSETALPDEIEEALEAAGIGTRGQLLPSGSY